jgi:DNA processing protein
MTTHQLAAPELLAIRSQKGVGDGKALKTALSLAAHPDDRERFFREHSADVSRAHRQIDHDLSLGIETIGFFDVNYPDRLREISDPPAVIWLRGSAKALVRDRAVAVVGTREPSSFGIDAARLVSSDAVQHNWTVVSGLALGIDTIAHETALGSEGSTVAVLAGGLDQVYPAANRKLAERIVEQDGALVSETPTGRRPFRSSFVARDRIQTALSEAVVICQTGRSGGTLHTARFAAEQGKPVFCPSPKEPMSDKSEGLRILLEKPANQLCDLLPQWSSADALCRRLGDHPLASPINGAGSVAAFFEDLSRVAGAFPATGDSEEGPEVTDSGWGEFLGRVATVSLRPAKTGTSAPRLFAL